MTNRLEDLFPTVEHDRTSQDEVQVPHGLQPAQPPASLRSAMSAVATGYAAAHGHPLEHDGFLSAHKARRRWALGGRAGLILIILVGLFGAVLAVKAMTGSRSVPLAADLATEGLKHAGLNSNDPAPQPLPAEQQVQADQPPTHQPPPEPHNESDNSAANSTHAVVVHVAGQVLEPGVVTLAQGTRVSDAVDAAGGLTEQADSAAINLARVIQDGEQIYVPAVGEAPPAGAGLGAGPEPQSQITAPQGGTQLNINLATPAELETLPGIGPALAGRIVAWREANGGFSTTTDLMSVSGIGPAVMGNVQDLIVVD